MACTSKLDIADGLGKQRIARERLHVLHVNHHLRGDASDADEAFVRELCRRFGLPLCVEHASFQDLGGQNLEAAAREVRYHAARRYVRELCQAAGCPRSQARILTAHTATDRAETFLMNAIRGAGPAGLSGIPRRRNIIVRPLIDYTHEELCRYLEIADIAWREDESNQDTSYLRNFVRHRVLPLARQRNGNVEKTLSATCDILGDEDAFMSHLAASALRACTRRRDEGLIVLDAAKLAAAEIAIARRMVRLAVAELDSDARLEMRHVESVLALAAAGSGSVTLPNGLDARIEFGTCTLRCPSAREGSVAGWLSVPGRMPQANATILTAEPVHIGSADDPVQRARDVSRDARAILVDAAALGYAEYDFTTSSVRVWVDAPTPGDVMCPLGMRGRTKKISDMLGEAQVPVAERDMVPVVRTAPGGSVVWLAGIRLDERFKCTPATRLAVKLTLVPVA